MRILTGKWIVIFLGFAIVAACSASGTTANDDGSDTNGSGASSADGGSTAIGGSIGDGGNGGGIGVGVGGSGVGGGTGPCGDGVVDEIETCDQGPDNGTPGSCCAADCSAILPQGTVCRPGSGDVCDAEEICDGVSPVCPADVLEPNTTECRADADADGCDAAEMCTGNNGEACPADIGQPMGTPCGAGLLEPTCNPDVCDGLVTCTDIAALLDGSACADNGGDTCCGAACVLGDPTVGDCCGLPAPGVLTIDVIESQSFNGGHNMDSQWQAVISGLGHNVTVQPQTHLDNIANLSVTDILVVSSGVGTLPANRVATITSYLNSGGGVYLQGEYQMVYDTNQAFAQIVNGSGGTFTWMQDVSGDRNPVTTQGCWATHPNAVTPLDYFWYGSTGTGAPEVILIDGSNVALGWSWCLPAAGAGQIVHTTDQDFIRSATAEDMNFMRNVIRRLAFASTCT